jgi:hypothetical protein
MRSRRPLPDLENTTCLKDKGKFGITRSFDDSAIAACSRIVSFRFNPGSFFL